MSTLQDARSNETILRLLDATIACLHERGYARTTTTEIANRAGVSRGAQLHHFPHKDDLVVRALDHVFSLRIAEMRAVADSAQLAGTRLERILTVIDKLWEHFNTPLFSAWLELAVASRTDPILKSAVAEASDRFGRGFIESIGRILEWPAARMSELIDLINLIFGQLESLALQKILAPRGGAIAQEFSHSIENLKRIVASELDRIAIDANEPLSAVK